MILGFSSNIENDIDRIFLSRLKNAGIVFSAQKSETKYQYSIVFYDQHEYAKAIKLRNVMSKTYPNISHL